METKEKKNLEFAILKRVGKNENRPVDWCENSRKGGNFVEQAERGSSKVLEIRRSVGTCQF